MYRDAVDDVDMSDASDGDDYEVVDEGKGI